MEDGEWSLIQFKYERLPTFCFRCGMIDYGERFCKRAFENDGVVMRKYEP